MKVYDIYSEREKRLMREFPDVYRYDYISKQLRVQIIHMINDAIGDRRNLQTIESFRKIHDILCRVHGELSLNEILFNDYIQDVFDYMLKKMKIEYVIDVVELSFQLIDESYRDTSLQRITEPQITPDEAIETLNYRFREHGVGYQYELGKIIRVDSQIIHAETVKPVLLLLSDTRFQGANEEFLKAHEHYRHGLYKECLVECLKAFESTMKTICDIQGWSYQPIDTGKKLIDICFQNNLIPTYLQNQFTSLKSNLESGIPTVRNKNGGHGQGSQPITVP